MPITTYTYPITDFPTPAALSLLLQKEIEDAGLGQPLRNPPLVTQTGGAVQCKVTFNDALSGGDKTTLDGLIAVHDPANDVAPIEIDVQHNWQYIDHKKSTWGVVGSFLFAGTDALGIPASIRVIAGVTTADEVGVRIYDLTNNNVIAEVRNQTGSYPSIINLGTISNLPTGAAVFELQVIRDAGNSSKKVRATGVSIAF